MSVELIDAMGNDLRVVNAAKVSFHKEATGLGEAEAAIIAYMLKEHHASPFEHVVFTFRVRTSIKVAREWFRHRTDAFNEESTRYAEMRPDFFVPPPKNVRIQVGRPGRYHFITEPDPEKTLATINDLTEAAEFCYEKYIAIIRRGHARELASFALPLSLLTEFVWTVKLRHALHFLSLRTAPTAFLEMQQEAARVEALIQARCPVSFSAWEKYGRPLLDSDWS